MKESEILTAIDVGTTKILAVVAAVDDSAEPTVLAHAVVPCKGLSRGNVENMAKTTDAVRAALDRLESDAGVDIHSAYVGVTGAHVSYENRRDPIRGVGTVGVITPEELAADISSRSAGPGPNRQLVHAVPISYTVDGEEGIRNPVGMHSSSVEVDTHMITADRARLGKLTRAVQNAGIEVDALVMEPLASGLSVLTTEEREQGALMIDIGGGTSDVVVFSGGRLCYTGVVPVGGFQFTNDVCITYNAEYEAAERAKLEHGHTEPGAVDAALTLSLALRDRPAQVTVTGRELAQLFRERAVELAKMVHIKLEEANAAYMTSTKIVLTGGASELPGIANIFQRQLGRAVRLGAPMRSDSYVGLKDPAHATGVGILIWASSHHDAGLPARRNGRSRGGRRRTNGAGTGVGRYFRGLMPWTSAGHSQSRA